MKKLIAFAFVCCAFQIVAQDAFGEIVGTVVDKRDGSVLYGGRVLIEDFDKKYNSHISETGRFRISAIPSGEYLIQIIYMNDTMPAQRIDVPIDGIANAGTIEFQSDVQTITTVVVSRKDQGIKLEYGFLPVTSMDSKEIMRSPQKFDISKMVSSMTTDVQQTDDGQLVFRGARKGDMIYMVDGMKVQGELRLPSVGIGKMMVYSGGLPAKFGDTMGGVVVIESKGYFDLLRSYKSAQLKAGL